MLGPTGLVARMHTKAPPSPRSEGIRGKVGGCLASSVRETAQSLNGSALRRPRDMPSQPRVPPTSSPGAEEAAEEAPVGEAPEDAGNAVTDEEARTVRRVDDRAAVAGLARHGGVFQQAPELRGLLLLGAVATTAADGRSAEPALLRVRPSRTGHAASAFVAENVASLAVGTAKGHLIRIRDGFPGGGVPRGEPRPGRLAARRAASARLIVIGFRADLGIDPSAGFPRPSGRRTTVNEALPHVGHFAPATTILGSGIHKDTATFSVRGEDGQVVRRNRAWRSSSASARSPTTSRWRGRRLSGCGVSATRCHQAWLGRGPKPLAMHYSAAIAALSLAACRDNTSQTRLDSTLSNHQDAPASTA